jgi:hypothetical protein
VEPRLNRLALFRTAFFAVLAADAWMQIKNAARYGAGGFNVAHFSWVDALAPVPTRAGMLVVYLALVYLALRIALGTGGRWAVVLATALFGYTYFISQLDSYQHHYLVFLILLLCCGLSWGSPRGGRARAVHDVAQRLVLVQVAVVYFWTAIAKLDPLWLDGRLLAFEVAGSRAAAWIEAIPGGFTTASWAVLASEAFLVAGVLVRRLHPVALPLGLGLHVGIELSHLSIGLFSYYMFALYLLLVPQAWIERSAAWLGSVECLRRRAAALVERAGLRAAPAWVLGALGACALLALPFDEARWVAAIVLALGVASLAGARAGERLRRAGAHVAACLALVLLGAFSATPAKYYEFWGQTADHLAGAQERARAYAGLVDLNPERPEAHLYFADALRDLGRFDESLAEYRSAQALDPQDYRPLLGEALVLYETDRPAQALAAVSRAVALDPDDDSAFLLHEHLRAVVRP